MPGPGEAASGRYPYVHVDEPLDTAMRRLAEAGVDTLPVVSRTDLGEVVGVISLQDVLSAYGFGDRRSPAGELTDEFQAPVTKLIVVVTVIAAMLLLAVSLGYVYRNRRVGRAHEYSHAASELVEDERYAEAVEQYRNALSITHNNEDRLALALTLIKADRLNEAAIYLHEVLHDHPTSGPTNLGLAEVDAAEGRIDEAVNDYHRALYGAWPSNAAEHKLETRIELAQILRKNRRNKQAQVELLALLQEMPKDPEVKKRVAHLLLTFGLPQESAEVFRDVLQSSKDDVDAYTGLGDAEAARWNYRSACDVLSPRTQSIACRPGCRTAPGVVRTSVGTRSSLASDSRHGALPAQPEAAGIGSDGAGTMCGDLIRMRLYRNPLLNCAIARV